MSTVKFNKGWLLASILNAQHDLPPEFRKLTCGELIELRKILETGD